MVGSEEEVRGREANDQDRIDTRFLARGAGCRWDRAGLLRGVAVEMGEAIETRLGMWWGRVFGQRGREEGLGARRGCLRLSILGRRGAGRWGRAAELGREAHVGCEKTAAGLSHD